MFDYVKRCLAGLLFDDTEQPHKVIPGALDGIEKWSAGGLS
jgi:hypothetical protein